MELDTLSIKLKWRDYTYAEDGFCVEVTKKGENQWKKVARMAANSTSYTIEGLEPGVAYLVRVRAFADAGKYSEYSPELTMTTRSVETGMVDIDSYQPDLIWNPSATDWDLKSKSWNKGQDVFVNGKNVLFDAAGDINVNLSETVSPAVVVVKGNGRVAVEGAGAISGEASVNKGGEGTLVLNTLNSYTGPTVLHEGILEINSLKNGSEPSAIGASANFAQSWIFDGGTYLYTGGTTSTDRAAQVKSETELNIAKGDATVTLNGVFEGDGNLAFNGEGQVTIGTNKFFGYKGATILRGGKLNLSTTDISKAGIGSSSKLVMAGGEFKTKGEPNGYETYSFPIEVKEGTTSQFSPNRFCYMKNKVTGSGNLQLNIPYLREYLQGNYTEFTGRLIANGVSSEKDGSLLLFNSGSVTMPNAVVEATGNTRLASWETNSNLKIGGLSGSSKTYLSGSSKKTKGFTCTWTVGSANTNETFAGKINNWAAGGRGYQGTVSITKTGTGYWRLTGNNDYKGITNVLKGNLIVNGTNSGTGAVNVMKDAILSGKGSIAGVVRIYEGGKLQAGDVEEGANGARLTLKGNLEVRTGGVVSLLTDGSSYNTISAGSVTLEDEAVIQIGDEADALFFVDGETIPVFSAGVKVNGKVQMIPETPGDGQTWDLSKLATEGVVKVVDNPTSIKDVLAGKDIKKIECFDMSGKKIAAVGKGTFMYRITTKNGEVFTRKIVR